LTATSLLLYSSFISELYINNDYELAEHPINEQLKLALEASVQLQQLNAAE